MIRCLTIALLACLSCNVYCQQLTADETIKGYNTAQKRLLLRSAARFTNIISQNSLDQDSVIMIAAKVTGLPFLVAYSDEDDTPSSVTADLINAGRIPEATQLWQRLYGEEKLRSSIELATWYLHKAGTDKSDLEIANRYIREALTLSAASLNNLKREDCLKLLAEYHYQSGNETESKNIYLQLISSSDREGDKRTAAGALHCLGALHAQIDSIDITYLEKSVALYRQLGIREKEIELLWDIASYHLTTDIALAKNDLKNILSIQQSINYRHSLFAHHYIVVCMCPATKLPGRIGTHKCCP